MYALAGGGAVVIDRCAVPSPGSRVLFVAEGLDVFEASVPDKLAGRSIAESSMRERTGCTVIAIRTEDGVVIPPS